MDVLFPCQVLGVDRLCSEDEVVILVLNEINYCQRHEINVYSLKNDFW